MPLFRKKSKADSGVPAVPAWHPNLRNYDRLPDTKVVRTAFFINGAAVLVVLVLLTWLAFEVYQLRDATKQIEAWQVQIDRDRAASNQAIATYKKFREDAAVVEEAEAFVRSQPAPSPVLLRLAETLPAAIALDRFELRNKVLTLRGSVRGSPDQASGAASAYLEALKADQYFGGTFTEIKLVSLTRNPQTGRLSLEVAMKLKEAK